MVYTESEIREEHGYRRGFDQGMYIVIKMIKDGYSMEYIEQKKNDVAQWRFENPKKRHDIPPVQF